TALHAAAEEFREVVDACSDENVARAKLGWWAEEMQRACKGQPRHPVTQVLAESLRKMGADAGRFAAVLEALNKHLSRDSYRSLAALESHYERLADITGCLAAELCGYQDPRTLAAARALGSGLLLAELARRPQRPSARRVTDLPDETLAACGATRAELGAKHTSPALKKAIATVAERARTRLRESLEQMPALDHVAQRSRRILAEIELAQLLAVQRADFAVLERPRGVTPLHKLWIAWKHRL
ncbi:MAG: hypothetical protein E4H01_07685, partial [Lysobacterales bacterium]